MTETNDKVIINNISYRLDELEKDCWIRLGDGAIKMADAALNSANKIMTDAKTSTDSSFFKFCIDLMEKGSNYIDAAYTNSGGFENVKLAVK